MRRGWRRQEFVVSPTALASEAMKLARGGVADAMYQEHTGAGLTLSSCIFSLAVASLYIARTGITGATVDPHRLLITGSTPLQLDV